MKFYFAARCSRHGELIQYRDELKHHGYIMTGHWLDRLSTYKFDANGSIQASDADRQIFAMQDFSDLRDADVIIAFTEQPRSNSRGARHVEFGIALALLKQCVIIGPHENVFHHFPGVEHFDSWEDFTKSWFPGWFD
jgi:hypothetical protein